MTDSADICTASAMALLRSTLNPRGARQVAPPNLYHQTSFIKKVEFDGHFLIGPDTNLVDCQVQTQFGMILWQPNRGIGLPVRMGFMMPNGVGGLPSVSVGSTFPGTTIYGFNTPNVIFEAQSNYSLTPGMQFTTLTFNQPFALPYNGRVSSDLITMAPDVSATIYFSRVFSGDMRVICDTTTNKAGTTIQGYLSCGAITDTRDVSQIANTLDIFGSGEASYDPSDLCQNSITSKEGLRDISVSDGIVSLIGSDIPPFYVRPNADHTDAFGAQYASYQFINYSAYPTAFPVNNGPGFQTNTGLVLAAAWVSPWGCVMDNLASVYNFPYTNISYPPIDEFGVLEFELAFEFSGLDPTPTAGNYGAYARLQVQFWHYFATCSSNGAVYWTIDKDDQTVIKKMYVANGTGGQVLYFPRYIVCRSSPSLRPADYTKTGKYIGTVVQVAVVYDYASGAVANGNVVCGFVGAPILRVRAKTVNEPGWFGPARVVRYDNMVANQVLRVDGVMHAQCIASASIAPYVQDKDMRTSNLAVDLNTLPWLTELYNGKSPLRRNWVGKDYAEFLHMQLPDLTPELIARWARTDRMLGGVAEAAGVFEQSKARHREKRLRDGVRQIHWKE